MSNQKANGEALRKRYDELQSVLALDTTNWDPRTLPGIEGRKNAAKIEIEGVKLNLARSILLNSRITTVIRDYEGTGQLVAAAKTNLAKNILLDYLSLEKGMYREIFGNKEGNVTFNTEIVNRMNMLLIDVGDKIGAVSMPALSASSTQYGTLKTRQEMIERMESVIEKTLDYELKDLFLGAILQDQVLERLDQGSLNILLVNAPAGFVSVASTFAGSQVVVAVDNPMSTATLVEKKAVVSEATSIAALIKPRKPRAKKVEEVTTSTEDQESVDEQ